jgi:hypothetical protein
MSLPTEIWGEIASLVKHRPHFRAQLVDETFEIILVDTFNTSEFVVLKLVGHNVFSGHLLYLQSKLLLPSGFAKDDPKFKEAIVDLLRKGNVTGYTCYKSPNIVEMKIVQENNTTVLRFHQKYMSNWTTSIPWSEQLIEDMYYIAASQYLSTLK